MERVLVVDDDATLGKVVLGYLRRAGFEASYVADGPAALASLAVSVPDLMVLDLMLPDIDGLQVCRKVRASHPTLPVIMLTALNEAEDRIAGLEVGADDYVAKPFSPRELVLRIESVLRRSKQSSPSGHGRRSARVLQIGALTVDTAARRATRADSELELTVREFDLLTFLMTHPGQAFRREELMGQVWGTTFGDHSTVTVHVRRLREKIESDPAKPQVIQTVWGVGYRLEAPTESAALTTATAPEP